MPETLVNNKATSDRTIILIEQDPTPTRRIGEMKRLRTEEEQGEQLLYQYTSLLMDTWYNINSVIVLRCDGVGAEDLLCTLQGHSPSFATEAPAV